MIALAALLLFAPPFAPPQQKFTSELWDGSRGIYAKTLAHPFLKGLTDGTLPRSRFQFYLQQDALYLRAFGQALSVLAAKAPREEWAVTLNTHAIDSLKVERQLHESILKSFGAAGRAAEMAPSNYAYTNHLLATVHQGTFADGIAAVLPCYWIYLEVGRELKKRGSKDRAYQQWIDQYSGEEYGKVVAQVLEIMNAEAAGMNEGARRRARDLFTRSARYEYMFWDMAWREERWIP